MTFNHGNLIILIVIYTHEESNYLSCLRGYHTLQGDNSLKSVECFDHMMFVCRFQASRDQNHREKSCYVASEFIALSLLVGFC